MLITSISGASKISFVFMAASLRFCMAFYFIIFNFTVFVAQAYNLTRRPTQKEKITVYLDYSIFPPACQ